ncbi:metallophosphoesterase family protein [Fluviicola sp.]|uniref:metallophosphoesterase family protein n=1 Tax=Fluviicola sp. TaxID=1917219 RepID=UPI0031E0D0B8
MVKIGLLSDTHGFLPERVFELFKDVDEIWHAGDIGNLEVTDRLKAFKPLRAVYGNIDDQHVRSEFPEDQIFQVEDVVVSMTHIAGRPGKYSKHASDLIRETKPHIFVCGHSHILLVQQDKSKNLLWLNPGACGNKGFHSIQTALRFQINGDKIEQMEVIEFGKRSDLNNEDKN